MVREFHHAIDHPVSDVPHAPLPDERLLLRLMLIAGETTELFCALCGRTDLEEAFKDYIKQAVKSLYDERSYPDLEEIARQACDVHVVVSGTLIEHGIPEDECYEVVHNANMAKVGGPTREDGKQLRPEGWEPPDLLPILQRAIQRDLEERRTAIISERAAASSN